jgi:hypothetical protein
MPRTLAMLPLAALAIAAALAGCAGEGSIAERATAYNKALERTGNQELLLNILRASRRRPEYFSYISQVHAGPGVSLPSAALSWPIGPGAGNVAGSVAATLGYVGTGSFDVGALDTDDFMRGITSAVDLRTVAHYWGQGWSPELLWFLLVRKVELRRGDASSSDTAHDLWMPRGAWPRGTHESRADPGVVTFENYPGDDDGFLAFKAISHRLLDERFGLDPTEVAHTVDVGAPMDAKQAQDLHAVLADASRGLALERLPDGRYQLQRTTYSFAFSYPGACFGTVRTTGYAAPPDAPVPAADAEKCARPPQTITIFLRSPEGVQYYLGELVRVALRKAAEGRPNILSANVCGRRGNASRETLLFDVRRLRPADRSPLEVEFEGERYGVPEEPAGADEFRQCDAESTMHVLSFVSQLLALQRSARDLPATGVVHVVQ